MKPCLAVLSVLTLASFAVGQTCTFTSFGRPCGGQLAGTQVRTSAGSAVRLDVTGATPGAVAVLAIGHAARPVLLPGGICPLVVDARVLHFGDVDRAGQAMFRFPIPATLPVTADVQVITVSTNRAGRTAEATNGLRIVCQ